MKLSEFTYNLPDERIAKYPPVVRGTTNLMVINRKNNEISDKKYFDIIDYIDKGDVVVLNRTKVQNVRTFPTVERNSKTIQLLFLENIQYLEKNCEKDSEYWYALIGRAKNVKIGDRLVFKGGEIVTIVDRKAGEEGFIVKLKSETSNALFEKYGHVPLPPYMKREDEESDKVRYNTVFAKELGSVAAPTASLNLTNEIIKTLETKGVTIVYVDLQISWGTFAPVKTENIEDFKIHSEKISISDASAEIINECIQTGKEVWAFGTTATRLLESVAYFDEAAKKYFVKEFIGSTNIFIYPGYDWKIVNHIITNFHTPESSLLMLVSSFMGVDLMKSAYQRAIDKEYMFLSYGDSMLIL